MKLRISSDAMQAILRAAERAAENECMGILAGHAGSPIVSDVFLLPSRAGAAYAEAAPEVIARCAATIETRHLIPKGLFHSHGRLGVFHSATDQATIARLLPQMGTWGFERPRPAVLAPAVTSPDTASLPMPDGRALEFMLLGRAVPGTDAHERAAWVDPRIEYQEAKAPSRLVTDGDVLRLEGDGVVLSLTIPDGASVTWRKADLASFRVSHVYSIVVNRNGDRVAECVEVYDFDGTRVTRQMPCEIEVEPGIAADEEKALVPVLK